jgi:F-type H+-transporting ATPase subunit gamma
MVSLKSLRDRITSVKATQKLTKAMQMVAAARLRRAQESVLAAYPYSKKMAILLRKIKADIEGENVPLLISGTGKEKVHFIVIFTSDRGLCGSFNAHIVRSAKDFINARLDEGKDIKIMTVGRKGFDILRRDCEHMFLEHIDLREMKRIDFCYAEFLSKKIIASFKEGHFDVCTLFYSKFESVLHQKPISQKILPSLSFSIIKEEEMPMYEYEPDIALMLEDLLSKNVSIQILCALLENLTGEMAARMRAMDDATRNAGEMIKKLSSTYNRQRQSRITTELIEIIAGAEAL